MNTNTSRFESLTGRVDVSFPEYDDPPEEPIGLLRHWLAVAESVRVREPKALALATAAANGRASTRVVAFSKIDDRGLIFSTHSTSRKSRELSQTGWASGVLYWRETGQQIMISGPVKLLEESESEAIWFARSVPTHAMTTASRQSEQLLDVLALRKEAEELLALGKPLPRPAGFITYCLVPHEIEFWASSSDRLHRRLKYDRLGPLWTATRLQP